MSKKMIMSNNKNKRVIMNKTMTIKNRIVIIKMIMSNNKNKRVIMNKTMTIKNRIVIIKLINRAMMINPMITKTNKMIEFYLRMKFLKI